ncbi:acetyltransferase [Fulvivirga sedimenti]|uniref:Acetyltransferase n=1 Tax=Fulvivirga sedimenti TaxID=2879465 RepID=A0A9X1HJU5_9BACT|nr:acetyltransferase [Fulvivirga sedimenti]MCA6073410.1 acetyltransferase [Fulvivirga sedimenti]
MYLFGASGHAKVICDILDKSGISVKGFIEDDPEKKELWSVPVVGTTDAYNSEWQPCLISIGNNAIRKKIAERIRIRYERAIHPDAVIARTARIDEGTVVMAGVVINPDTSIGRHVILNTRCSIDHDCHIGDFVHVAPGSTLCGGITVGEGTMIGAGATILPNITIGKWAVIGGGAVVTKDVPDGVTVVGCPAKRTNKQKNDE